MLVIEDVNFVMLTAPVIFYDIEVVHELVKLKLREKELKLVSKKSQI